MKKSTAKKSQKRVPQEDERGPASKPFSLAPLSFDEALGGLLETDAEAVRELERKATDTRAKKK